MAPAKLNGPVCVCVCHVHVIFSINYLFILAIIIIIYLLHLECMAISVLLLLLLLSQVRVVEEKTTKEIYAMKVMKKNHILQQADVSVIIIIIILHTYIPIHNSYTVHFISDEF